VKQEGQEQDEQWQQHEDGAEDVEREDGEYLTDEGDYAEYEEPDQEPDVKVSGGVLLMGVTTAKQRPCAGWMGSTHASMRPGCAVALKADMLCIQFIAQWLWAP
jgi:hypothetical protein